MQKLSRHDYFMQRELCNWKTIYVVKYLLVMYPGCCLKLKVLRIGIKIIRTRITVSELQNTELQNYSCKITEFLLKSLDS